MENNKIKQKKGEIATSKIVGIILIVLAVGFGLFLLFKANLISWVKNIFPDF